MNTLNWTDTKNLTPEELTAIDTLQNAAQHVRVDVYMRNVYDTKLGSIEGLVTGGNINVSGSSSVRRNGSLSLVAGSDEFYEKITSLLDTSTDNKIATNKEVEIFIGIEDIDGIAGTPGAIYSFKQGRFVMKTAAITKNTQGINISLTLSDLMSKLNGELGGTLSNAMRHHPETYDTGEKDKDDNPIYATRGVLVTDIIKTLVCEFGGIPKEKIILDDNFFQDKAVRHKFGPFEEWGQRIEMQEKYKEFMENPSGDGWNWKWISGIYEIKITNAINNDYWEDAYHGTGIFYGTRRNSNKNYLDIFENLEDLQLNTNRICSLVKTNGATYYQLIRGEKSDAQTDYPPREIQLFIIRPLGMYKQIKNTVRWIGNKPVYTYPLGDSFAFTTVAPDKSIKKDTYEFNDNIGYQLTDFTFPGKRLESNAGETIVSVLDKIKNAIGDYEYYFDIDGNFHFQLMETYLNDGSSEIDIESAIAEKYLLQPSATKAHYDFSNSPLITSYQSNPQWLNLKNDITVWGQRGDKTPLWYHLIIGKKYFTTNTSWTVEFNADNVPKYSQAETATTITTAGGRGVDWRSKLVLDYVTEKATNPTNKKVIGTYWEPYAKELETQWPRIYDIKNKKYRIDTGITSGTWLNNLTYFFDALDPNDIKQWASLSQEKKLEYYKKYKDTSATSIPLDKLSELENEYNTQILKVRAALENISVERIGSRQKVITNNQLNTMFSALYENILYVVAGHGEDTRTQRINALQYLAEIEEEEKPKMIQVSKNLGECISIGSAVFSLYDCVRANLHELTSYNETINVGMIPIFHLEPNKRATFTDTDTGISNDYIINNFSIPLAASGTMTLSCRKAIERI